MRFGQMMNSLKKSVYDEGKFFELVRGETGIDVFDISQRLAKSLENLFSEISSEYGQVLKKTWIRDLYIFF
jgi:hypothetical protein